MESPYAPWVLSGVASLVLTLLLSLDIFNLYAPWSILKKSVIKLRNMNISRSIGASDLLAVCNYGMHEGV